MLSRAVVVATIGNFRPMVTKWVQLLKDLLPVISSIALIFNPNSVPGGEATYRVPFFAAARSFGVEPSVNLVQNAADLEAAFAPTRERARGVVIPPDLFTIAHHDLIIQLAAQQHLPTIYGLSLFVKQGGLISYGPDPMDLHRRAVPYVDRILRGQNPADLPVQAPTKFELFINLKTAKALGLDVPPTLLATADNVMSRCASRKLVRSSRCKVRPK